MIARTSSTIAPDIAPHAIAVLLFLIFKSFGYFAEFGQQVPQAVIFSDSAA
jgi:hypothetical protein